MNWQNAARFAALEAHKPPYLIRCKQLRDDVDQSHGESLVLFGRGNAASSLLEKARKLIETEISEIEEEYVSEGKTTAS